jgi:hypothetical protein
MRDLVRAREGAHIDYTRNRQQVSSFLLRLGRYYPGKKTWGKAHLKWLAAQKLDDYEQRIASSRSCCLQCGSQESALNGSGRRYALAPVVEALRALRGIDLISAVVFMSLKGDLHDVYGADNPSRTNALVSETQLEDARLGLRIAGSKDRKESE